MPIASIDVYNGRTEGEQWDGKLKRVSFNPEYEVERTQFMNGPNCHSRGDTRRTCMEIKSAVPKFGTCREIIWESFAYNNFP